MNGKSDAMAQAVYLAQLEAQKGTCKCKTCQLLRKATQVMTSQFLGQTSPTAAVQAPEVVELINVGEEEG